MPNWVSNRVQAKGIENFPIFDKDKNIDFEKIKKMPEALNITSGGEEDIAVMCVLSDKYSISFDELTKNRQDIVKKVEDMLFPVEGWYEINKMIKGYYSRVQNYTGEKMDELYELGQKYCDNYEKYGATSWYNWCIKNWGTKWPAYYTDIVSENEVNFQTAWSAPIGIMESLSKMFPDTEFYIQWADEGIGLNTGCATFKNGEMISADVPIDHSNQAYENYIACWGETEFLRKNDAGDWEPFDPYENKLDFLK